MATLTDINEIGPALAKRLAAKGFSTVAAVAAATPAALAEVQGLSASTAANIVSEAAKAGASVAPTPEDTPAGTGLRAEFDELQARVAKLEKTVARLDKSQKTSKTSKNQKSKKKKRRKKK